jgi:hypothetical protein
MTREPAGSAGFTQMAGSSTLSPAASAGWVSTTAVAVCVGANARPGRATRPVRRQAVIAPAMKRLVAVRR